MNKGKALMISAAAALAGFAAAAQAEIRVGVATAVNPRAVGIPPQQEERVLFVGIDMQADERVITGPAGRAHLLFVDGSNLSVGPDSDVVIDKFVFDPQTKAGELIFNATRGIFRFVGGRISKTSEVQIRTPAAVVGLRGGVSIHNLRAGEPEQHGFLFGERMRVTAGGLTKFVTQPGFGISIPQVAGGAPPSPADPVRWAPATIQSSLGAFEVAPAGPLADPAKVEPGAQPAAITVGGSAVAPADLTAAAIDSQASSVAEANSASPPAPPAPFVPPPGQAAVVQEAVTDSTEQAAAANSSPPAFPNPPPGSPTFSGRFVGNPGLVLASFDQATANAPRDPSFNVGVAPVGGGGRLVVTLPQGDANFPFTSSPGVASESFQNFANDFGPPDTTLPSSLGLAIYGQRDAHNEGQFFFYDMYDADAPVSPFIVSYLGSVFGGVPTTRAAFPTAGAMRHEVLAFTDSIALTGDNIFLPNKLALIGIGQVVESPLYSRYSDVLTINQANVSPQRAVHMQASLGIIGSGASQKSFLVGETGSYLVEGPDVGGTIAFNGRVHGSYRESGAVSPLRIGSALATAEVGTAATGVGNAIFGPGGDYMVLTQERLSLNAAEDALIRTPAAGFSQPLASPNTLDPFALIEYAVTLGPPPAAPRTTRNFELGNALQGFMAGVVETNSGSTLLPAEPFSGLATITTSAENNRLEASFTVFENNLPTAALQFGDVSGPHRLRSAFIDDNIFAAQQSFSRPTVIEGTNVLDGDSRIFLVTSNTVPVALPDGVPVCSCDFLKWGWWGGEAVRRNVDGVGGDGSIRDRVHLATWVAGVVPILTELPASGTASYSGHAIGNVVNGVNKYIAAGNYTQDWNFQTKTGNAFIAGFDAAGSGVAGGISVSGAISGPGTTFSGGLTSAGIHGGTISGGFFKDPAAAAGAPGQAANVGGHFTINTGISGTYSAAGTVAAKQTSFAP